MKAGFLTDASLLIDLEKVGGLPLLSHLGRIHVTDLVREEVAEGAERGTLEVLSRFGVLETQAYEDEIREVNQQHKGLSLADASCLVLAKTQDLILLTGDRRLRMAAEGDGLEVHGALWVVKRLVVLSRITADEACRWLEVWRRMGRRLPESSLKELLAHLHCS